MSKKCRLVVVLRHFMYFQTGKQTNKLFRSFYLQTVSQFDENLFLSFFLLFAMNQRIRKSSIQFESSTRTHLVVPTRPSDSSVLRSNPCPRNKTKHAFATCDTTIIRADDMRANGDNDPNQNLFDRFTFAQTLFITQPHLSRCSLTLDIETEITALHT